MTPRCDYAQDETRCVRIEHTDVFHLWEGTAGADEYLQDEAPWLAAKVRR